MRFISNDQGFCPNTDAKKFEIILIVGFILTLILLIINFGVTLWFFKFSNSLLIIEIVLLVLNVLSIILTTILIVWRSDRSILDTNLWSSIIVAIFNLVIVIINFLLSIVEEVLFSFVFQYITYEYFTRDALDFGSYDDDDGNDEDDEDYREVDYGTMRHLRTLSYEDFIKMYKNYCRIMDKFEDDDDFGFDENDSLKDILKKFDILRILPWIALNFNILVQFIIFIFIIILMGRIKRQSDFGFPQNEENLSSSNRKLGKRSSKSSNNLNNLENNLESDQKNFRKKKHKKKSNSKKKKIRVHN